MLDRNLILRSYVIINEGCPLAITAEGPDHVLIVCGTTADVFEIVVQHQALRALVELGNDALEEIDAEPRAHASGTG